LQKIKELAAILDPVVILVSGVIGNKTVRSFIAPLNYFVN